MMNDTSLPDPLFVRLQNQQITAKTGTDLTSDMYDAIMELSRQFKKLELARLSDKHCASSFNNH